ncbi:CocE/NonD family hydrolase [Lacticaseibacillus absianus]|uniref:CocE/NonD family hydrolase n=1 Tax=Lacticaseibacillus absianus TaxID=2729623 RepID=UPI0015CEE05E|nr:CocE/NonD family hydrolase [Lacticaseibacillus absianus]
MTTFEFYQSGIREATFTVEAAHTAVNGRPLTDADWRFWASWAHFDLARWFADWADQPLPPAVDGVITAHGQRYVATDDPHCWQQRAARPAVNLIVAAGRVVGCETTSNSLTSVVIQPAHVALSSLRHWQQAGLLLQTPAPLPAPQEARVPMTDGVELATTVQLPATPGPVGTVFMRTPYGRQLYAQGLTHFAQRGFAVVIQDVRGRNDSDGVWQPMVHEEADGADALAWIAAQPWSSGKVGMFGGSYSGGVQWAAAASRSPHLTAMISQVTSGGPFDDMFYRNGAPLSAVASWLFATDERYFDPAKMQRTDWDELLKVRPLRDIPVAGLGHEIPGYSQITAHQDYDAWHQAMDWPTRVTGMTVPVLIQSGWYDDDGIGTTDALQATAGYPAGRQRVILGPWLHGGNAQYDLGPIHLGPHALRFDLDLIHQQWFDHWLNGFDNGVEQGPTVEYYVVHADRWMTAATFPPSGTPRTWHLDATTAALTPSQPQQAASLQFDYDPSDPTPQLLDVSANEFEYPNDYAAVEARPDVVSFTSTPLAAPLVIAGWFDVEFDAASSAVNTDWVVRLTDVTPSGESLSIADQVMNARFRAGLAHPSLLTPGQVEHYHLQTQKTAYQLAAGHRLRLDIASAADHLIFPNSNTAAGVEGLTSVVAHQTIVTGPAAHSAVHFTEISL